METTTHTSALTTSAADTLLLTLDEAARQLCCARRSVERHIASHRLRAVHLGQRNDEAYTRRLVAQLEKLGHTVQLNPVA